ncbi:ABC-2 transporter permease [Clostridium botulinum]|nr:ABC-2 transporter permease [Clostridium botulinum]
MKSIINLIINDLILCKKIFLLTVPMIIFVAFLGTELCTNGEQHYIFFYVIAMASYILISYIEQNITKNKSNMFIYSLPIEKNNIVLEKYLFVVSITIINWAICILGTIIFSTILKLPVMNNIPDIKDWILATVLISIYYSIYYPFYFKLGPDKLILFNRCIYMLIILLPSITGRLLDSLNISEKYFYTKINTIQDKFLWIILFEIMIIAVSAYISIIVHKNKLCICE